MALPDSWLDRLFGKLALRYADAWIRKWDGFDMADVRAEWAEQLAGLERRPDALRYALEYLPIDRPPNSAQFKALCDRAPVGNPLQIEGPKPPVNRNAIEQLREKVGLAVKPTAQEGDARFRKTYLQRQALEAMASAGKSPAANVRPATRTTQWAPQGPLPWPRGAEQPQEQQR